MSQDKEENHLIEERRKKLAELREANKAFPNDFKRKHLAQELKNCLLYTSPSPRDPKTSRMPSSA